MNNIFIFDDSDLESNDNTNVISSPDSIIKSKNNKHILTPKAIKNANKIKQDNQKINVDTNNDNEFDNFNNFNQFNDADFVKINIHVYQRTSRKHITIIENISVDKFENSELINNFLITLKNTISARATIKKKDNQSIIEVSGNKVNLIIPLICKFMSCTIDDIVVHGV